MKKIFLITCIVFSLNCIAQNRNNIKVDTLFFSGKIPKIYESKVNRILIGVENNCDSTQKEVFDNKIESNREFRTNSILNLFNCEAKTSIFTDADAVIIAYFCQNIDYTDEIELYEFIFQNDKLAQILLDKLVFLKNKNGFNDYIGFKNWYYRRIGNKVYFIDYKEESLNNEIFIELKKRIKSIN
ncbi:MAG: hypothetical protein PHC34_13240 [Candidatus Gastranaerophilales bacterium]|nr:hypothetical protein [Candidatus Gastranaerophilales bacterium]